MGCWIVEVRLVIGCWVMGLSLGSIYKKNQ